MIHKKFLYGGLKIVALLFLCYLLLYPVALLYNAFFFTPEKDISQNDKLLVIAAHQDDEAILAGGLMRRQIEKGGEVFVLFTVDGITRARLSQTDNLTRLIHLRQIESERALASLGIPEENVHFLSFENEKALQDPKKVSQLVDSIAQIIIMINPDRIVLSAFEGGHCDHDMTHFATMKAAKRIGFPLDAMYEAPEYNRYYVADSVTNRLNDYVLFSFVNPPRFLPGEASFYLNMTKEEILQKNNLFNYYQSQDPESLIKKFGYPDHFRQATIPDYKSGPFDPSKSLRHKICMSLKNDESACSSFYCGMSYEDYLTLYASLEDFR